MISDTRLDQFQSNTLHYINLYPPPDMQFVSVGSSNWYKMMLFKSLMNLLNLLIISIKFSIDSKILLLNKYLSSLKEYYSWIAEDNLFDEVAPLN